MKALALATNASVVFSNDNAGSMIFTLTLVYVAITVIRSPLLENNSYRYLCLDHL